MTKCLKRYWFEFDFSNISKQEYGKMPMHLTYGCGITAYNYEDALQILHYFIPLSIYFNIIRVIENIDISTIVDKRVASNLGVSVWRGMWFPSYNLWQGAYTEK